MVDEQITPQKDETGLLEMTADIVSAYASHNQMAKSELTDLILSVHSTLNGISGGTVAADTPEPEAEEAPVPAVPIDQSVHPDYIICLENGLRFKTLKRHLSTKYGMTPDEYRAKWNLSKDYPMVAPNYSESRASTAKRIGLGKKPQTRKGRSKK